MSTTYGLHAPAITDDMIRKASLEITEHLIRVGVLLIAFQPSYFGALSKDDVFGLESLFFDKFEVRETVIRPTLSLLNSKPRAIGLIVHDIFELFSCDLSH